MRLIFSTLLRIICFLMRNEFKRNDRLFQIFGAYRKNSAANFFYRIFGLYARYMSRWILCYYGTIVHNLDFQFKSHYS